MHSIATVTLSFYQINSSVSRSQDMAEESSSSNSLEHTPTWVVAVVCFVIVLISFCAERGLHGLGKVPRQPLHILRNFRLIPNTLIRISSIWPNSMPKPHRVSPSVSILSLFSSLYTISIENVSRKINY